MLRKYAGNIKASKSTANNYTPTDPNTASELQRLREKCARYEAVLFAISTMSTRDGDILTKMSLINAVGAAKDAINPNPQGAAQ